MTELFGTSGIRGAVGSDVTAGLALRVGRAVAAEGAERVVLGRDARVHGDTLADALAAGLRECGTDVLRVGVAATPTVARAVDWYDADAGVVITASHNPAPDNGIKLWTPSGRAFPAERRGAVEDHVEAADPPTAAWDAFGDERRVDDAAERHVAALVDAVELADPPSVIVDVGNGTGGVTAEALSRLGCDVETLNATPDGRFPARPSEPTAENCETLSRAVAATDADLGVAHDGDADRMRACTESGAFVDGNVMLALFAGAVAGGGDRVAAPLNVSLAVEDALEARGASLTRTRVGDVFVAAAATDDDVVFGGEESGAWIWPDETLCPDGPLAACKLAALVAGSAAGSFDALVDGVETYPHEYDALETDRKEEVLTAVERAVRAEFDADRLTTTDGVHVDTDDGWFMIRASGTEPKVRYRAEARDAATAERLLDRARTYLDDAHDA